MNLLNLIIILIHLLQIICLLAFVDMIRWAYNIVIFIVFTFSIFVILVLVQNVFFFNVYYILCIWSSPSVVLVNVWHFYFFTLIFLIIENDLVAVWRFINHIKVDIIILGRGSIVNSWLVIDIMKVLEWLLNYALVSSLMSFGYISMSVDVTTYNWRLSCCMDYSHRSMSRSFFPYFLVFKNVYFFFLVFFINLVLYVWSLRKLLLVEQYILFELIMIFMIVIARINLYSLLTNILYILI